MGGIPFVLILTLFSYGWIHLASRGKIFRETKNVQVAYTGILLGSLVFSDTHVSNTVKLRSDKAIDLYTNKKITRILVSGDHGQKDYDEVNAIKNYLIDHGVPESDVFLDHAGFDTYDSMVRAKKVFMVDDAIIISQDFHLPRAVYIANAVGLDAQGAIAPDSPNLSSKYMKNREILARVKAFLEVLSGFPPRFLGEEIPITGNSANTFD